MFVFLATGTTNNWWPVVLGVLGTLSTAVLLGAGSMGLKQFKKMLLEGRTETLAQIAANKVETQAQLTRIETQTTQTNGKVAAMEERMQSAEKALVREQSRTELLTEIYLKGKAE